MARPAGVRNGRSGGEAALESMHLIERYLFRQLLGPTLLATLALSAVGMLSLSLGALDIIVHQGQSPWVLAKITFLAMPQLLVLILPISLFVAALVALNRLHTEQEIVVCFASGMSRWRVVSPAIKLASIIAMIALVLNLWVAPMSERALRGEFLRVRTDLAASLIHVGEFTTPAPGLTVYAQDSDQNGVFRNLFVMQEKATGGDTTFLAAQGKIAKRNGQPVLVMRDGSNQEFNSNGVLNYLKFTEYTFDLSQYLNTDKLIHYKISDLYLHELVFPDLTQAWEQKNRVEMLAEANARIATPLYNIAFMAMALAAVIGGSFSRLGYGRRIVAIGAAAAAIRLAGFGVQAACDANAWLNILQYLVPLGAAWWAFAQLFRQRVNRFVGLKALTRSRMSLGAAA
jgi:lipopolysaccharide export system permease protein